MQVTGRESDATQAPFSSAGIPAHVGPRGRSRDPFSLKTKNIEFKAHLDEHQLKEIRTA